MFGSAVRGEMRPESDIDIMVEFEPGARIGLIKVRVPRAALGSANAAVGLDMESVHRDIFCILES